MAEIKLKNLDGFWESIPNLNNNDNNIAPTPNISITSVEGSSAKVTQSGTSENLQVTLTLPKGIDGDIPNESTLLKKSGNLGSLGGYNTPFVTANALTITQDSNDNNQVTGAVTITVNSGSSNTEWIKSVMITNPSASVSLGSKWKWSGGEVPTITENSLLVLHWCNDIGIANLVEGGAFIYSITYSIETDGLVSASSFVIELDKPVAEEGEVVTVTITNKPIGTAVHELYYMTPSEDRVDLISGSTSQKIFTFTMPAHNVELKFYCGEK